MNEARERLKKVRNKLGLTQKELAEKIGLLWYQIKDIEIGKVKIHKSIAKLLYYEIGVNPQWLLTGEGEMFTQSSRGSSAADAAAENDKYIQVPLVSGKISAGRGLTPDNTIDIRLAFRKEWIRHHGNPENMSLIKVSGDSMEPSLLSGDIVLVDHSRNYIDPQGGIYAVEIDNAIIIKRLQAIYTTKKIRIISDNQRYEPLDVTPEQIHINGKVIWMGRDRKSVV